VQFDAWPLPIVIGIFLVAALVIGVAGSRLAWLADRLGDRTGLGEAIAGAVFLGASTSLPGIITSVTTAWNGYAELSVSNAIGGIAAQTVFLSVADIAYRRANLEHAAASVANLMQATLLITLLTIPLLAQSSPEFTILSVHPATPIMLAVYIYGIWLVKQARTQPLWRPEHTAETEEDQPDASTAQEMSLAGLWLRFVLFAAIVGGAGWVIARAGVRIANQTGLSQTLVGSLLTAVSTSLPELVTSVAAVRQGALTLAVSGIIGGNAFDTLFLAVSDVAYREGSIYHAVTDQQVFLIALSMLLMGILLMGLLRREKHGFANIGLESVTVPLVYIAAIVYLFSL
jgi:cation:H+ antiporter